MPTNHKDLIDTIWIYGGLWWLWWIAMYLNQVRKWKPFKTWMFAINIFVAAWLWIVVKDFIPASMWDIQYSIVSLTWFLAFPILDYMEDKWIILFINKYLWKQK